jgi:hypothetical protein
MADGHDPSDDDEYRCTCGANRVPADEGTICVNENFRDRWPEFDVEEAQAEAEG